MSSYAILVWGANGNGAWRGLVTIAELIDLRPYIFQPAMYGRLIYTVIYMSDRLLTQGNQTARLPPPTDLRRHCQVRAYKQGWSARPCLSERGEEARAHQAGDGGDVADSVGDRGGEPLRARRRRRRRLRTRGRHVA